MAVVFDIVQIPGIPGAPVGGRHLDYSTIEHPTAEELLGAVGLSRQHHLVVDDNTAAE